MHFTRRVYVFLVFVFFIRTSFATDYSRIDEQSRFVPLKYQTPKEIAGYLTRNLYTPEEKVRALFYFTANKLGYDVRQLPGTDYRYVSNGRRDILREAVEGNKGVCQHYAVLFDALCRAAGIRSWVITGYTRMKEDDPALSHAWNAVQINDKYYCMDVTWSAGYIEDGRYVKEFNDRYFMVSPEKFSKTHVPFDPLWQFSDNPLTHTSFVDKNAEQSTLKPFSFRDSLARIDNRDTLQNLLCENARILRAGICNPLIKLYFNFNEQQINIDRFNQLVGAYNACIHPYNAYIAARNTQFDKTTLPVDTIWKWLIDSRKAWERAKMLLGTVDRKDELVEKQVQSLRRLIARLEPDIQKEENFLKRYTETPEQERINLFIAR